MLQKVTAQKSGPVSGTFAVVASRYNQRYVDAMLRSARRELSTAGVDGVEVYRVPGAFEIPVVAARLARRRDPAFAAVICLGVIFQGETAHARQIGDSVSQALAAIQIRHLVPVIHGVYLFDNEEQARVRCLGKDHNRGVETARTALEMAGLMKQLPI